MKSPLFDDSPYVSPPGYDEVIDRFALDVLNEPGDLVLKDGDLAVTKSGDLMVNNAAYSALFRVVQTWRYNAPTLQYLFYVVIKNQCRRRDLEANLNDVFSTQVFDPIAPNPLMPDPERIARFHELNDEIGAQELSSVACAGTVVLILNGLLLAMKDDLDASRDEWKSSPPLIEGHSIGSILEASANNFRHNDEWAKAARQPTSQQLRSIQVLSSVFKESIAPDGAGHKLSRDICPETLSLLGGGNFETLSSNVLLFANNLAKRHLNAGA